MMMTSPMITNNNNNYQTIPTSTTNTATTTPTNNASRSGRAQRELAALDFLLGIPLEVERSIVRNGLLKVRAAENGNSYLSDYHPTNNNNYHPRHHSSRNENVIDPLTSSSLSNPPSTTKNEDNTNSNHNDHDDHINNVYKAEQQQQQQQVPTVGTAIPTTIVSNNNSSTLTLKQNNYGKSLYRKNNKNGNHQQRWWDKLILQDKSGFFAVEDELLQKKARMELEEGELEGPSNSTTTTTTTTTNNTNNNNKLQQIRGTSRTPLYASTITPGRQLEGRDDAIRIQIPIAGSVNKSDEEYTTMLKKTRQVSIARQAVIKQWETKVAHGISISDNKGLLDGRSFLSSKNSYPLGVFSIIKYEPRKEEAARRRKKLEALGGGGTQFVVPSRDWRGISYRALFLPKDITKKNKAFHCTLRYNQQQLQQQENEKKKNEQDYSTTGVTTTTTTTTTTIVDDEEEKSNVSSYRNKHGDKEEESKAKEEQDDDDDDDGESSISSMSTVSSVSSSSSEESIFSYKPGFLDDPDMVQGRHRHVMVGDKVTGCIVSSTIQFVKPAALKANLNKQFRERFDGWEPLKKHLTGAKVIDGVYTLFDPTSETSNTTTNNNTDHSTNTNISSKNDKVDAAMSIVTKTSSHDTQNQNNGICMANSNTNDSAEISTTASNMVIMKGNEEQETKDESNTIVIRMPPSLTLSKIRSVKQQALRFCVMKANLEVSTVALACVYFERLCLACRVDKSNRRSTFASCLLLAAKFNEANVALVHDNNYHQNDIISKSIKNTNDDKQQQQPTMSLKSWIKPNTKHTTIFASLLEFFTHEWSLPLKTLFAAEWGVFAALGFSLHATPSQISFHYRRLMKSLEWGPLTYLGSTMYNQWQDRYIMCICSIRTPLVFIVFLLVYLQ